VRILANDLVSENASNSLRLTYRCGRRRRRRSRAEAFKNDDCTHGQSQQSDDDYPDSFRSHPFTHFAMQSILRCRPVCASSLLPYRPRSVALPISRFLLFVTLAHDIQAGATCARKQATLRLESVLVTLRVEPHLRFCRNRSAKTGDSEEFPKPRNCSLC
jgi:hypothetical protein